MGSMSSNALVNKYSRPPLWVQETRFYTGKWPKFHFKIINVYNKVPINLSLHVAVQYFLKRNHIYKTSWKIVIKIKQDFHVHC